MLTVIQVVREARVEVEQQIIGQIERGLLILCGFGPTDSSATLESMLEKCLNYRIFSDMQGKMNLNLQQVEGGLLLVPQFTLLADTRKGLRPSFSNAAPPNLARALFSELVERANQKYSRVAKGEFGADMQVHLCNDGPVTFVMDF
ncbi:D-aminoacyl-tRNA deacylase [Legionella sp. 16cNR16C]|uniref:D-aminoacyl-tRNA deacylase n=1 Tax=Legionella sp. 16cNR16C TaxID=2905656 RepID=UPI001E39341E|nr:D-aminoacyl-tRNA deacylase [Legionella sp. 16cNR16C]MCE3045877.1 D-aminoacyl-tRNA deacylase [Legionella sp. 16cNR16C]